jgi:hypothetical protein
MNYLDIIEESKTPNGVLMFDNYTIGNLHKLIENSCNGYFPQGSVYADIPVQFFFDELAKQAIHLPKYGEYGNFPAKTIKTK